jgi:signal transduction histidine kinase/CheY-like chemotaxis protein
VVILLFGSFLLTVPEQRLRLVPIGLLGGGVLLSWLIRRGRGSRPALLALALGLAAAIVAGMVLNGGVRAPAFFATLVLIVLIAASYGQRPLVYTVLGTAVLGGAFVAAEAQGWIPGPRDLPAVAAWAIVSVLALATAGFVYIPVSLLKDALERAERQGEELLRAKERLLEAEKMESLGRLAGGVAHDFNNVLAAILGAADLLRSEPAGFQDGRGRDLVNLIHESSSRAAELTRGLLLYARKVPLELRPVDLNDVVRSAASLLAPGLDKRISLEVRPEASPATVLGSAGLLEHAVINLGLNARDAISGAGRVTISTRLVELSGSETDLLPGPLPRGVYAGVTVQDTGSGIDPALRKRIFEPFFTTKGVGRGTGLGLPGVLGAASGQGGALRVDSAPGRGACFTLLLPSRPDLRPEPLAASSALARGAGRLLFVDDEAVLRSLGSKILTEAGYVVDVAADGREALEKFRAAPREYALVFLDLAMPVMNGLEFCAALREIDREVPVVVMTGYLESQTGERLKSLGVRRILEKPFGADALMAVAAECRRA